MQRIFCFLSIFLLLGATFSEDIFELTTGLDDSRVRFIFHGFRNFVFNTIGRTGRKTKGSFLQEKFPDSATFPCNTSIGKSKARPHSIHKLRPGGNYAKLSIFIQEGLLETVFWVICIIRRCQSESLKYRNMTQRITIAITALRTRLSCA